MARVCQTHVTKRGGENRFEKKVSSNLVFEKVLGIFQKIFDVFVHLRTLPQYLSLPQLQPDRHLLISKNPLNCRLTYFMVCIRFLMNLLFFNSRSSCGTNNNGYDLHNIWLAFYLISQERAVCNIIFILKLLQLHRLRKS